MCAKDDDGDGLEYCYLPTTIFAFCCGSLLGLFFAQDIQLGPIIGSAIFFFCGLLASLIAYKLAPLYSKFF